MLCQACVKNLFTAYQNIFLPIKNMRNNLKFYANMKLLTYRSFFFFFLKFKIYTTKMQQTLL